MLYNNGAPCYSSLFQEQTAIALLDTARQICEKRIALGIAGEEETRIITNLLNNEAINYYRMGSVQKGVKLIIKGEENLNVGLTKLDSSLALRQTMDTTQRDSLLADCLANKALIYTEQGKYALALKTIHETDSLLGPTSPTNIVKKENGRYNKAIVWTEMGKYQEAASLFEETTEVYKSLGSTPMDLFESYAFTGFNYANLGDHDKALAYYQKALQSYSLNFNPEALSYWDNPDINEVLVRIEILEVLLFKTQSLWAIARQNNMKELHKLLPTYDFSFELIEKLKSNSYSETVRYFLSSYGAQFTSEYLALTEKLGLSSPAIFNQVDSNRGYSQLQGIPLKSLQLAYNLSDSVRRKEARLDNQINTLSPFAFYMQKFMPDSPQTEPMKQQLAQLRRVKDSLIEVIKVDYPLYYALRYQNRKGDLQFFQEMLAPDQVLLTYYWGDSSLSTFMVSQNSIKRYTQPLDSLQEQIDKLHQSIQLEKEKPGLWDTSYVQYAHYLYQKLLAPALADNSNEVKRITIIPDQEIATVPFPMLIREKVQKGDQLKDLTYIGKEISFSYSNSTSLYAYQLRQRSAAHNKGLLAVAPAFSPCEEESDFQKSDKLCELSFSQEEVMEIVFKDKKVLAGTEVSIAKVQTQAQDYAVLHFSTHAVANNDFPEKAFIALRNGQAIERLRMKDIIDSRWTSELVVLSACQTAQGKFVSGEGVISLARAFTLGGAQSVVSSIWQVEDKATADLMVTLYTGINDNLPIDVALQQAQLDLIEKERHPFYWAAFMMIGNTKPLELNF
jgi:CHAT domain-containing protein